jgi:hypothetical protein
MGNPAPQNRPSRQILHSHRGSPVRPESPVVEIPGTQPIHLSNRLQLPAAGGPMFDELDLLRDSEPLRRLLEHYARLGAEDRQVWQDRVMAMDGLEPRELVTLYGVLIAFQWVELNTGVTTPGPSGTVTGCYRVTLQGLRALKRARVPKEKDEDQVEAAQISDAYFWN